MRPILLYLAFAIPVCDRGGLATFDEFVEADEVAARHHGRTVKLHGFVAPGSIERDSSGTHRFRVVRRGGGVDVTYAQALPERFQEKLEIVVTGELSNDGATMRASDLVAKCPSDYEALPQWTGDEAP